MSLHSLSQIAAPSTLDLYNVPGTQFAIQSNLVTEHRPIATVTSDSPLTFVITTPVDEYMQLKDALLYMKIRVDLTKKADGADAEAADWQNISTTNYLLHSMFKQVDVELNGKQITMAPQTYPYKAMIETMIGFTDDAKTSYMTAALYKADSTTNVDVIDSERGAYIRSSKTTANKTGKVLDLMGKLHLDLAFQERAIVGGSTIKIILTPHDPNFYLQGAASVVPKVHFLDASLFIHRSKVSPHIVEAHQLAFRKSKAKYPICRNEVKSFTITNGTLSANIDNIVTGQLPRRAYLALVSNEAFNGNLTKNPYNFKHYDINYLAAYLDGIQFPSVAYTPDFGNNLYIREYMGLFEALNQLTTDSVIKINRDNWKKGKTLFAFNFAPDLSNGCVQEGHASPIKKGSLSLQLRFKSALPETINVLVYLEYDNIIEIDAERQVTTDYI